MDSFRPDALIEVHYDMAEPSRSLVYTNVRSHDAVDEVLSNWVLDLMFRGLTETREPLDAPVHIVRVGLGIVGAGDRWGSESSTGNLYFSVGIVRKVLAGLRTSSPCAFCDLQHPQLALPIRPLSARPCSLCLALLPCLPPGASAPQPPGSG